MRAMQARSMAQALAWFDRSASVALEEVLGAWRGETCPTGHALDFALEAFGWEGKRFDGENEAHPLVFRRGARTFAAQPALVAPGLPLLLRWQWLKSPAAAGVIRTLLPLLATHQPRARLRMLRHRGVPTAAMIYDDVPIIDVFRRTEDGALLGLMDARGMDRPFFFLLRRSAPAQ
jgi:hypothetical protein